MDNNADDSLKATEDSGVAEATAGSGESIPDLLREIGGGAAMAKPDAEKPPADKVDPLKAEEKSPDKTTTEKKEDTTAADKTTAKRIVKDPDFVKGGNSTEKGEEGKESTDTAEGGGKDNPEEGTTGPVQFESRLSELTGGTLQNEEDFRTLVEEYNSLVEEKQKGFEPQFDDERTKKAYQLLKGLTPGEAIEQANRIIQTLRIDPTKMDAKELIFEGFLLEPENSDLTREKAWEYFQEFYDKTYSSDDLLTKRKLEVDSKKAKDAIMKMQAEYLKVPEEAQDQQQGPNPEVIKQVKRAVDQFGGLELSFSENAPENELMKVLIENTPEGQQELADLQKYSENPGIWWTDFINQFTTKNGFDHDAFVNEMYQIVNHKKLMRLAVNHGREVERLSRLNTARNSSEQNKDDVKVNNSRVPAGPRKEAGSFVEAFADALGTKV